MYIVLFFMSAAACISAVPTPTGCLYDGKMYPAGETIEIPHCLATVQCIGDYVLGDMVQLGGVCSAKRGSVGQSGCDYDGSLYEKGEIIIMKGCVGKMECLGNNNLGPITAMDGTCPSDMAKRQVDGQTGCLFDGTVYAAGDTILIEPCLAQMTCLGHNNYSSITQLGGVCP